MQINEVENYFSEIQPVRVEKSAFWEYL